MEKYKLSGIESLTPEAIRALIKKYKAEEVPRLQRLKSYYDGNSDIKKRTMSDTSKPNNRIDTNFCGYITDTVNGYFLGKPVNYQTSNNAKLMEGIQPVLDRNHEETHNQRVAKDVSITGVGYELLYMNESSKICFRHVSPTSVFLIYDTTIEENIIAAVRFIDTTNYVTNKTETIAYLYTDTEIVTYTFTTSGVSEQERTTHPFKAVPVNQFINNSDMVGDFEKIMDLEDAYNLAVSNTANDLDYFSDSYMIIKGLELESESDLLNMKQNRVIQFEDKDGDVSWLTKSESDMNIENYKNRLEEKIVQISGVPDLNSESFGSNLSGIAIRMKMFNLEQRVAIKENYFSEGLERRIELFTHVLNLKTSTNNEYLFTDITFVFTRNIPVNLIEEAQWAVQVRGILSDETILSNLSCVEDVADELDKLAKQQADSLPLYNFETQPVTTEG